jgi:hypothetical protein
LGTYRYVRNDTLLKTGESHLISTGKNEASVLALMYESGGLTPNLLMLQDRNNQRLIFKVA